MVRWERYCWYDLDEKDIADMPFTSNIEQSIHNSDNESVPELHS